ncbi:signal recognition particle-docking protein FtsY [Corynebacterium massiliense]|uniref:signal recognition particle-docking protein FtsY n=1 Tax=Corynebacterium massiliense TaxID=441501 RepID=UPI00235475FE|nr:signal recognition particle-docking protein FtsY [Corynebacterium massiliense]
MDQNSALWIGIGIAIVLILLLIALVVFGKRRGEQKKVSFDKPAVEDQPKKELTQQEKSGNYQAKSGFNFAPAGGGASKQAAAEKVPAGNQTEKQTTENKAAGSGERNATDIANAQLRGEDPSAVKPRATEPRNEDSRSADSQDDDVHQAAQEAVDKAKRNSGVAGAAGVAGATGVAGAAAAADKGNDDKVADQEPTTEQPADEEPAGQQPATDESEPAAEAVEADATDAEAVDAEDAAAADGDADADTESAEEAAAAAGTQAQSAAEAREVTPAPEPAEKVEAVEPAAEAQPEEDIEPAAGRLGRLRGRLSRSQNAIGQGLMGILSAGDLDDDAWEEIEDTLIMADLGTKATMKVTDSLQQKIAERGVSNEAEARQMLREALIEAGHPEMDRSIKAVPSEGKPAIVLVVGVNGTGKTTTTGKLGRVLVSMGHKVLFGAADTFRAAAADQLETWGRRVGATTVRGKEGADPASVAFDAVAKGVEEQVDVVLVDTAGRLHTKTDLMDQLGKVKRVAEKKTDVDEVLLVIDATVGQNGLLQARVFREVVDISGVVLTKLDGTAKGGIVFQVQEELGVPVKLVGLGEGADDLAPFEVESFVDALLG